MSAKPKWMDKHPCGTCGTGYGECMQYGFGSMCCRSCGHPGRWVDDPYTADDYREMWEGKTMPSWVADHIEALEQRQSEGRGR